MIKDGTDVPFSSTINGVDARFTFKIKKEYIGTENDKFITFGTIMQVRYTQNRNTEIAYTLNDMNGDSVSKSNRICNGDIMFKELDRSSFAAISEQILDSVKNDSLVNNLDTENSNNVFLGEDIDEIANQELAERITDFENVTFFDQLPYMDLLITSIDDDRVGTTKTKKIKDIKFFSTGSSEDTDSTEKNEIVKFISLSGVTKWE